jgi:hypothetical protein
MLDNNAFPASFVRHFKNTAPFFIDGSDTVDDMGVLIAGKNHFLGAERAGD